MASPLLEPATCIPSKFTIVVWSGHSESLARPNTCSWVMCYSCRSFRQVEALHKSSCNPARSSRQWCYGIAALKLFVQYDLFDRLADRSRVPDETLVPWYQELYYQVITAARRVKDPFTGTSIYFTPHCFRHSFATALAPLIGGDAKTGAKILGHSPQTFMRYVRANDETARTAIEKLTVGFRPPVEAPEASNPTSSLRVLAGGRTPA